MDLLFSLKKKKLNYHFLALLGSCFYLSSCATQHPQYGKNIMIDEAVHTDSKKIQSIYLLGNAGNLDLPENKKNLEILNKELSKADTLSYLIFLGNNVFDRGIVTDSTKEGFTKSRNELQIEIDLAKKFKGKTLFIPGNFDWKNGIEGLQEQENIVKRQLTENSFLPKGSCPLEKISVNNDIEIIAIDSEWYLQDWDKHKNINKNCFIKSREDFFRELENQLNKFQNKQIIIAMHHPLYSNGIHGGYFDIRRQLFPFGDKFKIPLPIVGSFLGLLRSTTGLSVQDTNNHRYRELASHISTLIQNKNNVILVSSHDNSLQYIQNNNIKQIISGSVSRIESAKAVRKDDFSYGDKGYAVLDIYQDGTSVVNFYAFAEKGVELLLSKQVTEKKKIPVYESMYDDMDIPEKVNASVYPKEVTEKSAFYKFFFGEHYRSIYGEKVLLNTLNFNNFNGGLTPIRMTIDSDTKKLFLNDSYGIQYNIRSIKKSATDFIQKHAFKDKYIANEFEGSYSEKFLMDFYTTNHPYYPLVASRMMTIANISHADPRLYYLPKQPKLNIYNEYFANEMYTLEEYNLSNFLDSTLGMPIEIVTTEKMLSIINRDNNTVVDKQSYMRIRLFDMLVGNWDRTEKKLNWAGYKQGDKIIYRPISNLTDQVFPRYDGLFFNLVLGSPNLRHMQDYKGDIKNVKWLNRKSYALDLAILESSDIEEWKKEVKYIQQNITESEIRNSFDLLPQEIKDEYDNKVIMNILSRIKNLEKYAEEYNKVLRRLVILKGTNSGDKFEINRLPQGVTNIKIYSADGKESVFNQDFNKNETKEIRLYGLNGKDCFIAKAEKKIEKPILIRIIGGLDDNVYDLRRAESIRKYDYKINNNSSKSIFRWLKNIVMDYDKNIYSYKDPEYNYLTTTPTFGYNPDDGLKLGFSPSYIVNGFDRNPYSQKHNFQLNYNFATRGLEAKYKGTFVRVIGNWNLDLNLAYTSPAFSANFFGLGNTTVNNQRTLGMDYNRIRLQSYSFEPVLIKMINSRSSLAISALYSYRKIQENLDRIVGEQSQSINREVFTGQNFGETGIKYIFKNYDNGSLPTSGMTFLLNGKWITNLSNFHRNFFYTEVNLGFTRKITADGRLTIASMLKGKAIWGNNKDVEFYQMPSLGGDLDFRGYRRGRFSGDKIFLQSSDLRFDAFGFKAVVPVRLGVFVGADYGRVWLEGQNSRKWHTSIGSGIWLTGAQSITASISYFKGEDPGRVVVGLNFGF